MSQFAMAGAGLLAGGVESYLQQKEARDQARFYNKQVNKAIDSVRMDKAFNRLDSASNEAWATRMIRKYGDDANRIEGIASAYGNKADVVSKNDNKLTSDILKLYSSKIKEPKINYGKMVVDAGMGALSGFSMGQSMGGAPSASTTKTAGSSSTSMNIGKIIQDIFSKKEENQTPKDQWY